MGIAFYDEAQVDTLLDYPGCIRVIRQAMIQLSTVDREQPLRQIVGLGEGQMFGLMPGRLSQARSFGAKLVSVFEDVAHPGRSRHRGIVVDYDGATGEVRSIADAEPVTRIRTAAATAVATDALARSDASILAILGTGIQAEAHARALMHVRSFERVLLWGRNGNKARTLCDRLAQELDLPFQATDSVEEAASQADIITTVSAAAEPILLGRWVREGTHVNLVGSSFLGPVEADIELVTKARYIADYRPSVLAQASELDAARKAGLIDNDHVVGEIGEILAGHIVGRQHSAQITLYKSLGNIVQDLAAAAYIHKRASGISA